MASFLSGVPMKPPDSLFGVNKACNEDTAKRKVNVTVGAYRDDDGQTVVLQAVRLAEERIFEQDLNHEYLPLEGLPEFNRLHAKLVFGDDSVPLQSGKICSIQGISGTGCLRLAAEFCKRFIPDAAIYLPATTWATHWNIFRDAGIETESYSYVDSSGLFIDFEGLMEDLCNCPEGSIVLLHMVAHNPTGIDPSEQQWRDILEVVRSRRLFPIIDNAYQGFVKDLDSDAYAARLFADAGVEMMVACSCSKNFGLYNERAGCLHTLCYSPDIAKNVLSQLTGLSRTLVSNCPAHGARIVATILADEELKHMWVLECAEMADRLSAIRLLLHDNMIKYGVPGNWDHIVSQRGMFTFSGISPQAVEILRREHHIYMLGNGRISLAGLNTHNVEYFAQCVANVLRELEGSSSPSII